MVEGACGTKKLGRRQTLTVPGAQFVASGLGKHHVGGHL